MHYIYQTKRKSFYRNVKLAKYCSGHSQENVVKWTVDGTVSLGQLACDVMTEGRMVDTTIEQKWMAKRQIN